jgi:ubiquinone/menaquinone biosynthesis C-methylase UbiE
MTTVLPMSANPLDDIQAAAAAQFDRQSHRYGKSHILADTSDIASGMEGVAHIPGGAALDVATGGGHTALYFAQAGWNVIAGDVSQRMLENARKLAEAEGVALETQRFPAEEMPFPDSTFDLVTVRVAPHHFSSPAKFVSEVARVLKPGGRFLLIDGSLPDNDPETDLWLNQVEKWRDPSHGRLLSRTAWETLVRTNGMVVEVSQLNRMKQPDLNWYFETAATSPENRIQVLDAIEKASPHVRTALGLADEEGKIIWYWQRLTLRARKPAV